MASLVAVDEIIEIPRDFMTADEDALERTFIQDAELEVGLVDAASGIMVHVLTAVGPRKVVGAVDDNDELMLTPQAAEGLRLAAMTLIGGRALRVIRAARAVLARGFESEARALDRILVELQAHRGVILDDPSGKEAWAWMQRESRWGISRKVAAMGEDELYGNLSGDAHGDPMPLLRMRNVEENSIELAPSRTAATRASLLLYASFARDQAMLVSKMSGSTVLTGIEQLDAGIDEGWRRLGADEDGQMEETEAWTGTADPGDENGDAEAGAGPH